MSKGPQLHQFKATVPEESAGKDADTTNQQDLSEDVEVSGNDDGKVEDDSHSIQDADETEPMNDDKDEHSDEEDGDDDGGVEDQKEDEHAEQQDEEEAQEDTSGTSVLPLSKVKKIFKTDPEHLGASEAAVFTTAVATELFIQYFTEQASLIARSEKRKKLQYKDFSAAVASIEQLQFLNDTVPQTHNLKGLVEKNKVKYNKNGVLEKGQRTLQFGSKKATTTTAANHKTNPDEESDADDFGDINDANINTDIDSDDDNMGKDTDNEPEAEQHDHDHDVIMAG